MADEQAPSQEQPATPSDNAMPEQPAPTQQPAQETQPAQPAQETQPAQPAQETQPVQEAPDFGLQEFTRGWTGERETLHRTVEKATEESGPSGEGGSAES